MSSLCVITTKERIKIATNHKCITRYSIKNMFHDINLSSILLIQDITKIIARQTMLIGSLYVIAVVPIVWVSRNITIYRYDIVRFHFSSEINLFLVFLFLFFCLLAE